MASTAPVPGPRPSIRDPIFIVGCHKSGASLLRSLFDGHPALYVYPHETHFFQMAGLGVEYPLRRSAPREMGHAEMVEKMVYDLRRQNAAHDALPESRRGGMYDVQHFSESMLHAEFTSPAELFEGYHGSLIRALEGEWPSDPVRIVAKSVELAEYAAVLATMYPSAHFVHIMRNPYATLVAIRRSKQRDGRYPYMGAIAAGIANNLYYAFRNRKTINQYHVIRYEDLVSEPERVMRTLATAIALPFAETLLRPTQNGRAWSGKEMAGISPDSLDRWKGEITPYETHLVNAVARPLFTAMMYEEQAPERRAARPVRGERPRVYAANRLLLRHGV